MRNPYLSLLRTAWRYSQQHRKRFVLVYAMFAVANIIYAGNPILYGWFVDSIQRDANNVKPLAVQFAIGYVLLKLLEWSFHGPARVMERQLAFELSRSFLAERYHQALHLPVKWHQDHHSGSTINRIRKAYEALKGFFDGGFMYIHAISKLLFSLAAMLWFSPVLGLVGLGMGVLIVWIIFQFDGPYIRTQEEVNEKEHVISATLFDSLANIFTVITLRLEQSMERGLMGKVAELLPPFRRNVLINEWKWFTADNFVGLTYGLIAAGYVWQNWKPGEVFYVGGLVTLLGYVNQFTSVFHDVAWQYTQIVTYNTDVETARSIEEAWKQQHRADQAPLLPTGWRELRLENISYSHRDEASEGPGPQSLHNLHLVLPHGARIALVGESGCGKSTLLALLRGLYVPRAGFTLRVDGTPAELASINSTTTLMPQEPEIFENTIRYNVTLGLPFTDQDIDEVCNAASFSEVITQLPQGLASNIQEKGVNLSGGQKQRLALARGILAARASDIVLLDEPTSSVDPKTEAEIYERMFEQFQGKTIVSALHRLHLLRRFDYIYVLRNGQIAEEGTFAQLRASGELFQQLWRHQEDVASTV
jgi:ATP-binding cassette, subfamily B, bacterial